MIEEKPPKRIARRRHLHHPAGYMRQGPPWWSTALPSHQSALRTHLGNPLDQSRIRRMAERLRRRQETTAPRPTNSPLRYRRNRKRKLALQKPLLTKNRHTRSLGLRNPGQLRRGASALVSVVALAIEQPAFGQLRARRGLTVVGSGWRQWMVIVADGQNYGRFL
jgi:hypothetical protein